MLCETQNQKTPTSSVLKESKYRRNTQDPEPAYKGGRGLGTTWNLHCAEMTAIHQMSKAAAEQQ